MSFVPYICEPISEKAKQVTGNGIVIGHRQDVEIVSGQEVLVEKAIILWDKVRTPAHNIESVSKLKWLMLLQDIEDEEEEEEEDETEFELDDDDEEEYEDVEENEYEEDETEEDETEVLETASTDEPIGEGDIVDENDSEWSDGAEIENAETNQVESASNNAQEA